MGLLAAFMSLYGATLDATPRFQRAF
ncbi:hypothetical protein XAC3810_240129 [Xanthomonas citri pv. citri]|uniref:Uncharacterized protein n=1 Tax=Xanthomonas citri pv. citri TaxID=611301 RepID=A0A0U4YJK0_XANCI|nr:hypothetical protein XAC9322_220127 [Xanthomonas citri pv. citri]CEE20269.1 hypothetical protein XAC3824_230008 [Xanthomonas citri pv. citri]CEE21402.1 hypothetical protein XAC1083_220129 [Xanthomonas citri pv. citri]CEE29850.1 hypothetical protein XAC3810_240129 [Xanthomonas citri pv. citri]CEE32104.1 hypothetical protein XAC902_270128 [Xanthomonas citri pv. citri]